MENLTFVDVWAPLINFFLFCIMAYFALRGMFGKLAKSRKDNFIKAKDSALKVKQEAEEKLAELNKEYEVLESTLAKIKANAEAEAKREAERIIESAKHAASALENEVKRMTETELALAKAELRDTILSEVKASIAGKVKSEFSTDMANSFLEKQTSKMDAIN